MTAPVESTARIDAADGTTIFYRTCPAEFERARMVVAHGLGEHSGRYGNLTAALVPAGFSLWLPDHRGHGESSGKRGHVDRFGQYVADLNLVLSLARKNLPTGRKCFLLGHSMGGLIAARCAQQFPAGIDGLVLSSPVLGVAVAVPPAKRWLAKLVAGLFPSLSMGNELDPSKISRDPAVVKAYRDDPLVHDRVSARWFTEFLAAMQAAHDCAGGLKLPVLMQVAGEDHLVSAEASKRFFDNLGAADKTFRHYEGCYHEVYNAPADQRAVVLEDLRVWLEGRIGD